MESESPKDNFHLERLEKFFKSSYRMEGQVEYFDGSHYTISELLLVQNASDAIKEAKLEMEVLGEKDVLIGSGRIYYNVLDPSNLVIHMYDSSLKDEHSN